MPDTPIFRTGKISSIDGGTPPVLSVLIDSQTAHEGVRYLADYTPVVNDIVLVARTGLGSWIVLGEVAS